VERTLNREKLGSGFRQEPGWDFREMHIRMVSAIRTIAEEGLETSLCNNRLGTGLEIRLALPSWQTNLVSPLESLLKAYLQFHLALDRQTPEIIRVHNSSTKTTEPLIADTFSAQSHRRQHTMVSRKIDPEIIPLAYGHEDGETLAPRKKASLHQRFLLACRRLARVKLCRWR